MTRVRTTPTLASAGLALLVASTAPADEPVVSPASFIQTAPRYQAQPDDAVSVYVVLEGASIADLVPGDGTADAPSSKHVRAHLQRLQEQREAVIPRLVSLGARVDADLRVLANALQVRVAVRDLERIMRLPSVVRVDPVAVFRRATASAVPFVGAPRVWGAPVSATGKGVRVGIIDTGIDYLHADFGGKGSAAEYASNDRTIIEEGTFPTIKVIGGWDFVGDAYDGYSAPVPDPDPIDCAAVQGTWIEGGHGTHVAGIVAGNGVLTSGAAFYGPYEASFDPLSFRIGPGVAPEASLYALKVFGCEGATTMVASALERAADPDQDGNPADRLDVVNMSLGGSYGLASPTDEQLIANLTKLGALVVVAAGNDGDTFYVAGAPATYTEALAVAAITDPLLFLAMSIDAPSSIAGEVPCVEGAFTRPLAAAGTTTGQLVATAPLDACQSLTNAASIQGKIALINRGTCPFVDKIRRAADAGATAVVVIDNADADVPFAMGGDGYQANVPGVMIRKQDGAVVRSKLAEGVSVTLSPTQLFPMGIGADQMAGFSSRGPRATDSLLKPDIAAPGLAIDSAGVASGWDLRQNSGTSMACPVVAGAAALLKQARPELAPLEMKAALMNHAAPILADAAGNPTPVSLGGAGRLRIDRATKTSVTAAAAEPKGAVSVSFGSVVARASYVDVRTVVVTNHGDSQALLNVEVRPTYPLAGASVTPSTAQVTVPAGETASFELTLNVDPSSLAPAQPDPHTPAIQYDYSRHFLSEVSGHVVLTAPGEPEQALVVPYHAAVRAGDERQAGAPVGCPVDADFIVNVPLQGPTTHHQPLVSAFELGALSDRKNTTDANKQLTDLLAVGAASNIATAESFAKASVYFGIAIAGEWTTPARGPMSIVGVKLDTDGDQSFEYIVYAEPLTKEGPYLDVLVATTYAIGSNAVVSKRHLNIVSRDLINTEPFNNSVVILPVTLGDIGLTEQQSEIGYVAFTQNLLYGQTADKTPYVRYDPARPALDTAVFGELEQPFYVDKNPIRAKVAGGLELAQLPQMLLLHHTNVAGRRMEVVNLAGLESISASDLRLSMQLPEQASIGADFQAVLDIDNGAAGMASSITLDISAQGAEIVAVEPSSGACEVGSTTRCAIGDLGHQETSKVVVTLTPTAATVTLRATALAQAACEADPSNNQAQSSLTVTSDGVEDAGVDPADAPLSAGQHALPIDGYEPSGGCACELGARDDRAAAFWPALAAAILVHLRRRRPLC